MGDNLKKTIPFNLYDFYGYIFPAVLLLTGTYIILLNFQIISIDFAKLLDQTQKIEFFLGLTAFIVLASITYFLGHINATIAHLIYDRFVMKVIIGYPILELLNVEIDNDSAIRNFSKSTIFYILITSFCILLYPLSFIFPFFPGNILFFLIFIIIVLMMTYILLDIIENGKWKIIRSIIKIYCFPYYFVTKYIFPLLKKLLSCDKAFHHSISEKFSEKLKKDFDLELSKIESDSFWFATIKILSKKPELYVNLENWLNLYGFLRNLSTAGILLCLEFCFFLHFYPQTITNLSILLYFLFLFFSVILGLRYWIIYRNYYVKYVIRCYVAMD